MNTDEIFPRARLCPAPLIFGVFTDFPIPCHRFSRRREKGRVVTSAEVVPDLGKKDSTTDETISAYFTVAAAAFGLISDGCEYPRSLRTVPKGLHINGLYKGLKFSTSRCNYQLFIGLVRPRLHHATHRPRCYPRHCCTWRTWECQGAVLVLRRLRGIGVGGEYPTASTSTSEASNDRMLSKRGPGWFLDLALSGGIGCRSCSVRYGHKLRPHSRWPFGFPYSSSSFQSSERITFPRCGIFALGLGYSFLS
ncbi:hypothetical protein EDB92DRAFT_993065 [Lactarius akahatsu]|uniref:Uncharacterized protein n=1 Tax=Lactarius akahatsu TaxID=416441 RepID=A0AAD4LHS6_9AGAM|nr:hypothetical protein EDB92DRAFT_993065 [Lactarius akahatsu]